MTRDEKNSRVAEVIRLDGLGLETKQIASTIGLTQRHVQRILAQHRESQHKRPDTCARACESPSSEGENHEELEWNETDLDDEALNVRARGLLMARLRRYEALSKDLDERLIRQLRSGEPTTRIRDVTTALHMAHGMITDTLAQLRKVRSTKKRKPARPVIRPRLKAIDPPAGESTGTDG